jgi:hypothetical protein
MKEPKNVTEVQSFSGKINFYGKFIPNKTSIAEPLYALLRIAEHKNNKLGQLNVALVTQNLKK